MLDLCIFVGFPEYPGLFTILDLPKIVKAVTGWETSVYELMKAGERGVNMLRIFNIRERDSPEMTTCFPKDSLNL